MRHNFFVLTQPCSYESILLIYLLILGFLAPDKVDAKFFDPKFAFKEVEVQAKTVTELVTKKKPKVFLLLLLWETGPETGRTWYLRSDCLVIIFISLPKAEGYAEGDLTLYHRTSVTDFLRAANPVDFLSKASEVSSQRESLREVQKHGQSNIPFLSLTNRSQ